MEVAAIFGGFGGQGLLFAGHVLAEAAVIADLAVSWMPSYGPEMRGGTASCSVIIADHAIGSPIVDRADVLVALNQPSLVRFRPLLVDGGLLIVNTSLADAPPADGAQVLGLPCSRLAALSGDDRVMSTVALGALLACRPIMPVDAARRALVAVVGEGRDALLVANVSAFDRGYEAALAAHGAAAA